MTSFAAAAVTSDGTAALGIIQRIRTGERGAG
jgi:hypothetical protein